MNQTLFLAEKILMVLDESNQTLQSQIAATEIVMKLFNAEPYGSLAHAGATEGLVDVAAQQRVIQREQLDISSEQSSAAANQSLHS
jgi:hypothetical protein